MLKAEGQSVTLPINGVMVTVKVSTLVKVSLRTRDPREAKHRSVEANAALQAHWQAVERGPQKLTPKQVNALSGDVYRPWADAFADDPVSSQVWQRVLEACREAEDGEYDRAKPVITPLTKRARAMNAQFGPMADAVRGRHGQRPGIMPHTRPAPAVRFVTYLRVSVNKRGSEGLGTEAQRSAVDAHVRRAAGPEGTTLAEDVESGKLDDRPKLRAAIEHAEVAGARLAIAKLDRLSRDVRFLSGRMKSGVDFVAADMPGADKLTVHILAAVVEHEREAISAGPRRHWQRRSAGEPSPAIPTVQLP